MEVKYSVVIPVFNRPIEVKELLESLCAQTYKEFEVIIVEDGSEITSIDVFNDFRSKLNIQYFFKLNSGPGLSRNYGAEKAHGQFIVFFDSDCLIPEHYFESLNEELKKEEFDAYGGPDMAHSSFTNIQKSISYAMTSFLTTGGIRGGKRKLDKFHPRSFNMGFTQKVFKETQGFSKMRFGEDIDMSLRIFAMGFRVRFIETSFVFHKRRTDFRKFFKQIFNSGMARINLYLNHPKSLSLVHFLPAAFVCGAIFLCLMSLIFWWAFLPLVFYSLLLFMDALVQTKNLKVSVLCIFASFVQLFAYGLGFLNAIWKMLILKKKGKFAFENNFYK